MNRSLQLALLGAGQVTPNPMVGAVLVYEDKIIGEGYHKKFGEAHAEVNCINSVKAEHVQFIKVSTLYVSLEPCAHFGKTPPCADLIIKQQIPHVVIACRDVFKEVNGRGIEKLKNAGIQVTENVLEKQAQELNKRFFTFHEKKRPYIFLKWAQTADGFIAGENGEAIKITNELTNRWVHEQRSKEAGALGGGISGSGPSIFMLSEEATTADAIALIMQDIYQGLGIDYKTYVTTLNTKGVRICD